MRTNQRKRVNHKIIKINRSKRYSDRIIITLDNKSVFRVPEDAFVLSPLNVGDMVSINDINKYDKKMRIQEAKDASYRLLSYRMRSVNELKKRLQNKSFLPDEIDQVIKYLLKMNYLNDLEFARLFSKEKVKIKKIGPILLKSELFKHGLDADLIEKVTDEIYNQYNIHDLIASHLVKKKIIKNKSLDDKDKKRLNNFLIRKGFNWGQINDVYIKWGQI